MTQLLLIGIVTPDMPICAAAPHHLRLLAGPRDAIALPLTCDINPSSEAGTVALLQAQNTILCHYAALGDVLPVAPGGAFSCSEALLVHLHAEAPRFAQLETRFRGCAEYALSVVSRPSEDKPEMAGNGRDHLRLKARARDRRGARSVSRQRFAGKVTDIVKAQSKALRVRAGSGTDRIARVDFLIPRDGLAPCRHHLEATLEEAASLDLLLSLSGPYPAFSFVGGDDHAR